MHSAEISPGTLTNGVVGNGPTELQLACTALDSPAPRVVKIASVRQKGTVINQAPNPGTNAELGSLVTIYVSSGAAPKVVVPGVVGHTQKFAELKLTNAGFTLKVEKKVVSVPSKVGKVLSQDPKGGEKAEKGSAVTIVVGVSSA